ncbi:MAG TPA: GlsB/YeaQ/YmgE family stress response membrane protein [Polyangiaceae bacterium]|jgi:uncharacterized membrane protein YeaQ/YmgE (transglycosylase-associated protein family)|nr:GlsB/YeaQ/YmgE family stress response membrane protein [Polyangiaceae bacterium]
MGILFFIVFGFIVGLLARALMPGEQKMGLIMTTILGVAGSFIGGFLTSLFTSHRVTDLHTAGIIGSVIGALVLLFVAGGLFRSRAMA